MDFPVTPAETPTWVRLSPGVRPEGDTVADKEIIPEKPSTLLSVMSFEREEL